eukprot:m.19592 g.19592  ORF g.19592 m.19592 type:complete len:624 (+) comp5137_c0_seq1:144-2015(+)
MMDALFLCRVMVVMSLTFAARCGRANAGKPPNIIFILADDLGYGDVSISPLVNRTNMIPTKNIQRLADNGMKFLRGYSGQVCAPSRCSLMTGRHSGHCTIRGNDGSYTPLLDTDVTIAHVLGQDYSTALFGKWGLGDFNTTGYPTNQGFDIFVGQDSQSACHNWYPKFIQNNNNDSFPLPKNEHASEENCGPHHSSCTWCNDYFAQETINYIQSHANDEKPFFIFFSTTTPHVGDLTGSNTSYPTPAPYDSRFPDITDETLRLFATAVSAQDDFVGAVLDELEYQQILNNTIVFFSGDNGPDDHPLQFFDGPGPFRGKKRSLHEGGIRQTIVAQWPGHIPANSSTEHLFSFIDFLPTAADLAGLSKSALPDVDGLSAASVLLNEQKPAQEHAYLYWEYCFYHNTGGLFPNNQYKEGWAQAIRFDEINNVTGILTEWKGVRANRDPLALFNLTADISESVNVTAQFPTVASRAISYMDEAHVEDPYWKSSYNDSDKCCALCYHPDGCSYPCVRKTPTPVCDNVVGNMLKPIDLDGLWIDESHATYNISVNPTSNAILLAVVDCPHCCWDSGKGVVADRAINVTATGISCTRDEIGTICDDGNSIKIVWSSHWKPWTREQSFDLD